MMGKVFTLSQSQLKVLLAGRGFGSAMGVLLDDSPLDNETVVGALNSMVKIGLLSPSGGEFTADPELRAMTDVIGSADRCLYILSVNPALPDKCVFNGAETVCCTVRPSDSGHIAMEAVTADGIAAQLYDEGYLTETEYKLLPPPDKAKKFEDDAFAHIELRGALTYDAPVVLSIEQAGAGQGAWMRVLDYYYCKYIAVFDGKDVLRLPYNRSNITQCVKKMIENDFS